jgi:hypothetical protein
VQAGIPVFSGKNFRLLAVEDSLPIQYIVIQKTHKNTQLLFINVINIQKNDIFFSFVKISLFFCREKP